MTEAEIKNSILDNGTGLSSARGQQSIGATPLLSEGNTVVTTYHLRSSSLLMIKQLMHLCRDTQKHRGLGMGLLAGNTAFAQRFYRLQTQMARRVDALYTFSQTQNSSLSVTEINKINEAWATIREGWHEDSVLESFQFHSYVIEQLLHMVIQLSQCLQAVPARLSDTGSKLVTLFQTPADEPLDGRCKDDLLVFVCYQLPRMIESLGMVRALATHSASLGHHIEEHDKKMRYLCQCVQTQKYPLIKLAEKLQSSMGAAFPSVLVVKTYEFKVDAFIEKVSRQVIGQENITVVSDDLFAMVTDIMDVYWRIIDEGLDVLHHQQDEALDTWYLKG
ncbi:MAG: hypothetical protein ACI9D5_000790 [Candidatus Endobugula sp.]|jgi:hypothetical protein